METMYYDYVDTPIGSLMLAGDGDNLIELGFPTGKGARRHLTGWVESPAPFNEVKRQLEAYFKGSLQHFTIPVTPRGTPFQCEVWSALQQIPYGETISYGELASRIGRPTASRAVGAANGQNPIPVIIPCHRVIGASGRLVGFGGGLQTKQRLLDLESETLRPGLALGCG